MPQDDLLDEDAMLPGDVVVDEINHRPMQVTGFDLRRADKVDAVWNSRANQHHYDLDPEDSVLELVGLPTGQRYFVPADVERYPEMRLKRVLTGPATDGRRVQAKVVRSVLAHLVADASHRGHDKMAEGILTLCRSHFTDSFVNEVEEFSETVGASPRGGHD